MAAMLLTIVMTWVVQLPIAYLMTRASSLGAYGVRWATVASLVFGAIVFIIYFRSGRWKTVTVN